MNDSEKCKSKVSVHASQSVKLNHNLSLTNYEVFLCKVYKKMRIDNKSVWACGPGSVGVMLLGAATGRVDVGC